ncbi:ribbon-helix-helix protein, CopG family, partial [Ralstonia solanacearum]|nr:ribbon-helix-helix protein, CopG family [Ralstonia solanacearum]MDB0556487.1 ribbon-helix-helix protein, CopG family [Ralstonia solanacearum]
MAATTERIVVRVTTAQKRAIVSTAKRLGLNVSELMRQAIQD